MRTPRYDPRASARRGVPVTAIVGLAVLAALLGFVAIGLRAPDAIPGRSYYTFSIAMRDANTLAPHSDVRIGGARVGQTLKPRFEHGQAVIDLQLDTKVRPLLSDTTVRIRPKSAIGQPYVDLQPGRTGSAIEDGGRLAATHAQTSVPLDRVLSTLDSPTRRKFQTLMTELGRSVAGRGEGGGQSLEDGPAMLRDTATVTRRLAAEPGAVRGFVRNSADLADTFAGVKAEFAGMFDPAQRVMAAIARERGPLDATLTQAPGTFASVSSGLSRVDPALDELGHLAVAALPPLRLAPHALRETSAMLREVPRSVPQVDRTLRLAGDAVPATLKLLRSARAAAPRLDGLMSAAAPTVTELAPRRCDIVRLARNWQNMFAFGEAGQMGGTGLDLNIATPGTAALGGNNPLTGKGADIPTPRSAYPAPCDSYSNAARLGAAGG